MPDPVLRSINNTSKGFRANITGNSLIDTSRPINCLPQVFYTVEKVKTLGITTNMSVRPRNHSSLEIFSNQLLNTANGTVPVGLAMGLYPILATFAV